MSALNTFMHTKSRWFDNKTFFSRVNTMFELARERLVQAGRPTFSPNYMICITWSKVIPAQEYDESIESDVRISYYSLIIIIVNY